MSKIDILVAIHAKAAEDNDTEVMEQVAAQIEKLQDKQRRAFERDRPQIMDAIARARREMVVVHCKGEEIAIAH